VRGADMSDWELFGSAFTLDAEWDLTDWAIARYAGTEEWNSNGSNFDIDVLKQLSNSAVFSYPVKGRKAIIDVTRTRVPGFASVHQLHNPEIEFVSGSAAKVIWPVEDTIQFPEGAPVRLFKGLGAYHETYVSVEKHWLISTCRIVRLMATIT